MSRLGLEKTHDEDAPNSPASINLLQENGTFVPTPAASVAAENTTSTIASDGRMMAEEMVGAGSKHDRPSRESADVVGQVQVNDPIVSVQAADEAVSQVSARVVLSSMLVLQRGGPLHRSSTEALERSKRVPASLSIR